MDKYLDLWSRILPNLTDERAIAKIKDDLQGVYITLQNFVLEMDDLQINAVSLPAVVEGFYKYNKVKELLNRYKSIVDANTTIKQQVSLPISTQLINAKLASGQTSQQIASEIVSKTYTLPSSTQRVQGF